MFSIAAVATSLAAGTQVAVATAAQAVPGTCSSSSSGATAHVRCTGTPSNGWTQYRFTLTCFDGPTQTFVGGGTSSWVNYGSTASKTCGAPQRQTASGTAIEFR